MKFQDILKRLFKKTKQEYYLVNNLDVTIIPTRKVFKDNKEIIKLIDFYKKEYQKILRGRIFTSIDLKLDDLVNSMNMNIDLVLKQCLNDKNKFYIDETLEDKEKKILKETNNITSLSKLELYQNKIQELEIRNISKVIALNELSKEIKYNLSPNKRNVIKNELSNLTNIMTIFKSQTRAISLEIYNYKKDIEHTQVESFGRDRKYKNKRYNNVNYYGSKVLSKDIFLEFGNEAYYSVPFYIAIIERELEIYVYQNKSMINELNLELDNLSNIPKTKDNRDSLYSKIKELEIKYQLFDLYGYNLVSNEDLNKLYRLKFDILTVDINNLDDNPFKEELENNNKKEIEIYKDVITEKIHKIYNGEAIEIKKFIDLKIFRRLIKVLNELLKNGKYYDYKAILNNHLLLALILAFDKYNGIEKLFQEFQEDVQDYKYEYPFYYRTGMVFETKIPLETVCKVLKSIYETEEKKFLTFKFNFNICNLYDLKQLVYKEEKSDMYKIPEGIKIFDCKKNNHPFLLKIRKELENNNYRGVIFPSTLKYIKGKIFGYMDLESLIFNEGLESIEDFAFYSQQAKEIVLSSTLKKIEIGTFDYEEISWLKFTNFKESKVLFDLLYSDSEEYREILEKFFYINEYDDQLDLCNKKFSVETILCSIILYDELGKEFIIDYHDMEFNIDSNDRNDNDLFERNIKLIREHLINAIYEKTGYKIKPIVEENDNTKTLIKK